MLRVTLPRCVSLVLLFGSCAMTVVNAEETTEVLAFVDSLKKQVEGLTSMSCRVEMAFENKPPFAFLDWAETASSFRYEYTEHDDSGKQVHWGSESSGLTSSMEFMSPNGQLVMRDGPVPYRDLVKNFTLPGDIWEFVFNRYPLGAWKATNTEGLQNPDVFTDFAENMTFIAKERLNGIECLVFDVEGGKARFQDVEVRYRVYVDPSRDYLPLSWKTYDSSGVLLSDYQVIKFAEKVTDGSGLEQVLPEEVKMVYFKKKANSLESTVNVSLVYKYRDVVINEFRSTDEVTLDPSIAEAIHDQKEDILIRIPK